MANEDENANLHYIASKIWEERCLTQHTELHVVAALLVPSNHAVKIIDVTTELSFSTLMHRFFDKYINQENKSIAIKQWLAFRDQEDGFYKTEMLEVSA